MFLKLQEIRHLCVGFAQCDKKVWDGRGCTKPRDCYEGREGFEGYQGAVLQEKQCSS